MSIEKKLKGLIVNYAPLSSVGDYYGYGRYGETGDDPPAGQAAAGELIAATVLGSSRTNRYRLVDYASLMV